MIYEEAVQALKHHELTYHTVTDTMLEKESEKMHESLGEKVHQPRTQS